jgi:hypothetical protein
MSPAAISRQALGTFPYFPPVATDSTWPAE